MNKPVCKGSHKGHLCVLASDERFEEIKALVAKPKVICFNCGRVANSRKNLCNPMPLKEKK
ncbi:MAG: hypothetical protein PHW60_08755 [Kiritimatiellae bacterium]|nr:hypothetical protein [Kiritimatiellia bacterium]